MAQEKNFSDEQNFPKAEFQQNFNDEDLNTANIQPSSQKPLPRRERIKHVLIGSPKAVTSTIHLLQILSYANVGDWSPLQPIGDSDEVMSILIRQISVS